jgi:hypothetical protein
VREWKRRVERLKSKREEKKRVGCKTRGEESISKEKAETRKREEEERKTQKEMERERREEMKERLSYR